MGRITQHPTFQRLESQWHSIVMLVNIPDITLHLFITDTNYKSQSDLSAQLMHIIQHDYFLGFFNDPLSLLIYDSHIPLPKTILEKISSACFLPILTESTPYSSRFVFSLTSKQLVRRPYSFESTSSLQDYLWSHPGYTIIQNIFSNHSVLTGRFQSLSSSSCNRHTNTETPNLPRVLFFCRVVHAIQQILRYQIGKFNSHSQLTAKLRNWINQFTSQTSDNYPLQSSSIQISRSHFDSYDCIICLKFHGECEMLRASLTLDR